MLKLMKERSEMQMWKCENETANKLFFLRKKERFECKPGDS